MVGNAARGCYPWVLGRGPLSGEESNLASCEPSQFSDQVQKLDLRSTIALSCQLSIPARTQLPQNPAGELSQLLVEAFL
jgi:hypothetical protein